MVSVQQSFLMDWRELKLEREVWRSLDMLNLGQQAVYARRRYYTPLLEPAATLSKVSV